MSRETKGNKEKRKHIFPELPIASAKCMLLGLHAAAILRTFDNYPRVPSCKKIVPRVANGPETKILLGPSEYVPCEDRDRIQPLKRSVFK
jgi:hypothetical protein